MKFAFLFSFLLFIKICSGQSDSLSTKSKTDFQIHLTQPAKSIKFIMYEKDFTPVQGKISEDKKSVIIKDYIKGSKVRVKVEYEDGTTEEIIRSPCFIDPVIS